MAMQDRYFFGVLPFLFFVVPLGANETVLMIHPYEVREVIGTGGMAERKSAYPHQTEGLTMDVRILFLTAQPPLPLAPVFLFVESGTCIGTTNHLPLTGEPQKVVRTSEAGENVRIVSVRASRIGILYGHTSFVRLQLVHAFKLASKLKDVFFSHAVSAFRRCSIQSASCYAYLHFATSTRRIRRSFSFGCKGYSGICRKCKVKPPVLREKSPALRRAVKKSLAET